MKRQHDTCDHAAIFLADLRRRGVTVRLHGERIGVRPGGVLSDSDVRAIRGNLAGLLELLAREQGAWRERPVPRWRQNRDAP